MLRFVLRAVLGALATVASVPLMLTLAYSYFDPPSLPIVRREYAAQRYEQEWVPLSAISADLVRAVLISEDARFCFHWGVDLNQVRAAAMEALDGEDPRGASTITMQVVRNLFLWPERSYLRKALEVPLALWVDLVLSKDRILEIYLNIAQWGPIQYGAEAGARRAFDIPAADVKGEQALALATVLPAPSSRNAARPTVRMQALIDNLRTQLDRAPWVFTCLTERIQP